MELAGGVRGQGGQEVTLFKGPKHQAVRATEIKGERIQPHEGPLQAHGKHTMGGPPETEGVRLGHPLATSKPRSQSSLREEKMQNQRAASNTARSKLKAQSSHSP